MNWSRLARVLGIEENDNDLSSKASNNNPKGEPKVVDVKEKSRDKTINIEESVVHVNKFSIKKIIMIALGLIIFYLAIKNIAVVISYIGTFISFFTPFILGAALAFIINVPMTKIEGFLFKKVPENPKTRLQRCAKTLKRPVSMLIALVLVFGVIVIAGIIIVPQVASGLESLAEALPGAMDRLQDWISKNANKIDIVENLMNKIDIDLDSVGRELANTAKGWATAMLDSGFSTVSNIVNGIFEFVIGLVFAIYILLQKEKLGRQGKQIVYATFTEKTADKIMYITGMTRDVFKGFISGQCVDGIINAILFFIILTILGIPYAVMLSIFSGFMAMIPIIGSFIGAGVGVIIVLIMDPSQVLYFIIMYIIVQQIDGNVIYPLIAGNSMGLPSIWVLMAVTVGGSMMGILGMILFIPICSVLYQLTRHYVLRRLDDNDVDKEKWEKPLQLDADVLDK
ncbi:MAG: AI-2E family transporter [Clostridiales bacterium]|nr:AI-2E family transporter [Clostridiales bacterium]MDY6117111.1 AI-2E family transporter [Anaerovoracaceae bacterium]